MADQPDSDSLDANGPNKRDDFLGPDLIGSGPRTKHPDEIGDAWHPCRHFIDPLANELEEWWRAAESEGFDYTEPTTLDRLTYIIVSIVVGGPGSVPQAAAWRRARGWFDVHGPAGFRGRFAKRVKGVWKKIKSLERRLKDWLPADDSPDEDDDSSLNEHTAFEFKGFLVTVIEPFIADLRNWSRELKKQTPPKPPKRGGKKTQAKTLRKPRHRKIDPEIAKRRAAKKARARLDELWFERWAGGQREFATKKEMAEALTTEMEPVTAKEVKAALERQRTRVRREKYRNSRNRA
jgi:hypothetical protein